MASISRRKLADWTAEQLENGKSEKTVFRQLAAYLLEHKRSRELDLIVRDIESALATRGTVSANVTTARKLTDSAKTELETLIKREISGVKTVSMHEIIDEGVIGGYKLELPGKTLDATVKSKLDSVRI